jgi:hypothetical protein
MTESEPLEGWGYLVNVRHAHYFREAKSLCRRWLALGGVEWSKLHPENPGGNRPMLGRNRCCRECYRRRTLELERAQSGAAS